MIAAYEKWGEIAPERFLGEFSFAIWDDLRECLFCCRDQIGIRPFLYWQQGSRFAFGASPSLVLSLPGVERKPNLNRIAVMGVRGPRNHAHRETFHEGIYSLPYGSSLTFDRSGLRERRYWRLGDTAPDVPKREDEIVSAFRDVLFESVRCRICRAESPAVLLSGGLDSSSVAALAARSIATPGKTLRVLAGVLPADAPSGLKDEREFIDEFQPWQNLRIAYISPGGNEGPFDGLPYPDRVADTPLRNPADYLYSAFQDFAQKDGVRELFTGAGGEFGATAWSRRGYLQLAAQFRWGRLYRELAELKAISKLSPPRVIGGEMLRLLFPSRKINPVFLLKDGFRPHRGRASFPVRSFSLRRYETAVLQYWLEKHANRPQQLGVGSARFADPLLDRRILEFCLKVPVQLKVRNGYQRYLVRAALDGILPKKIQWRTDKVPFSPDYFLRYNRQLPVAQAFVDSIGDRDPVRSVVNIPRLRDWLHPLEARGVRPVAASVVPNTLNLICFLRQFSEFRP